MAVDTAATNQCATSNRVYLLDAQTPNREILPPWKLPIIFFAVRAVIFIVFALFCVPFKRLGFEDGALLWLLWPVVDFPLGFLAFHLAGASPSNGTAMFYLFFVGGFQWIIWGRLITGVIRSLQRRASALRR